MSHEHQNPSHKPIINVQYPRTIETAAAEWQQQMHDPNTDVNAHVTKDPIDATEYSSSVEPETTISYARTPADKKAEKNSDNDRAWAALTGESQTAVFTESKYKKLKFHADRIGNYVLDKLFADGPNVMTWGEGDHSAEIEIEKRNKKQETKELNKMWNAPTVDHPEDR